MSDNSPEHVNEPQPLSEKVLAVETSEQQTESGNDNEPVDQVTQTQTRASETKVAYSVYSQNEIWAIVLLVGLAALFSPLTANIYFPAIPTISKAFHRSIEDINLTVTVYMILQGLAPSAWGAIADRKGRRPSFILCLLILSLSCIGIALTPTSAYWLLVLLRCAQAAGSASTIALSFGVVVDIIPIERRGGYVGIMQVGPMLGPCIGPVIGGALDDGLGWRAIFWFLAIATGFSCLSLTLLFPETLRSMVGNGSIPAPKWNRALIPIIGRSVREASSERPPYKPLPNPFRLFFEKDIMILLVPVGITFSAFYAVTATISSLFVDIYPFLTVTDIGLCFLAVGGGGGLATVTSGKILDWQFKMTQRRLEEKEIGNTEKPESHKIDKENFPIEYARLRTQHIWVWLYGVSVIGYGWSLQSKTNIAVPLILQFIIGFSMVAMMTNVQSLLVDLFPTQGSSVTAANNLVRCLMGAATVSVINLITNALKPGWTYTLIGGICLATWPSLLIELRMGPKWRKARVEKNRVNSGTR